MKKSILIAALLVGTFSAGAQLAQTTTQWAKLLDAAPPDMGIDFALGNNALYYLSCTGSTIGTGDSGFPKEYTDVTASIYFDDQLIATGAPYEGASFNNNFSLVKTTLDGSFGWTVYSTSGDFASNNGGVAPATDGGVYVSTVMRHTDNLRTEPIRLVDANGNATVIDWTLPDTEAKRWHQGLLMKVSAQGTIEWTRLIEVDHAPVPAATGEHAEITGSAFYISGMASDAEGNFYIGARYATPITIGTNTFTPHNTEGWNGDSQQTRGDVLIAKFDAQGNLLSTLTTTGTAHAESNATLTMAQGNLWLAMTATGTADGNCAIALDGHRIALPDEQQNVVIARLDTDLHVRWLQQWSAAQVQNRDAVMQCPRLSVAGDNVWFTGQCNGAYTCGDVSVTTATGNVREGIVVKCDAATGQALAATTSKQAFATMKNGIQGYVGAFENETGTDVCVYGYTFGGESVTLMRLDAATLEGREFVTLIAGGSMPTAQKCIAKGSTLYTLSRGRDSHIPLYQLQPIGSDLSLATQEWAVCMAAFTLPFGTRGEQPTTILGDLNDDGVVDIDDLNIAINIILKKDNDAQHSAQADIDGDGAVDISDVNAIINLILGKG